MENKYIWPILLTCLVYEEQEKRRKKELKDNNKQETKKLQIKEKCHTTKK